MSCAKERPDLLDPVDRSLLGAHLRAVQVAGRRTGPDLYANTLVLREHDPFFMAYPAVAGPFPEGGRCFDSSSGSRH